MERLWRYYSNYQSFRGRMGGLPTWARTILLIAALPGIAAIALSILAFVVSLLALLLLTAPVYSALKSLTSRSVTSEMEVISPGAKRVDVRIVE